MATSCTRIALLAIALLVGTSTTGLAHPSDWADVVETRPAKTTTSPKQSVTAKKKASKAKQAKQAKQAKKAKKAKARAKAKRRR